ncbi:MAG: nucleotide sugar dehydrogenase, partial [Candidatus Omnitrophota bacterium]
VKMKSRCLTRNFLKEQDLVLIAADHSGLDYGLIAKNAELIFDTRNIFEQKKIKGKNITKL